MKARTSEVWHTLGEKDSYPGQQPATDSSRGRFHEGSGFPRGLRPPANKITRASLLESVPTTTASAWSIRTGRWTPDLTFLGTAFSKAPDPDSRSQLGYPREKKPSRHNPCGGQVSQEDEFRITRPKFQHFHVVGQLRRGSIDEVTSKFFPCLGVSGMRMYLGRGGWV
jgi:hypothetical protein